MTTFDGAGVRCRAAVAVAVRVRPLELAGPPTNGTSPLSRLSVTTAMSDQPDDRRAPARPATGPGRSRTGPRRAAGGAAGPAHDAVAGERRRRRPRRSAGRGGLGVAGRRVATSRISSWSDLEAAERPADEPRDDVEPVALVDDLGEVGPAEGDPVEHVALAAQGQLAVAAVRGADAGHGQPEDGDERIRVARAARREAGQLAKQGVVDVERRQRRGRSASGARGSRGARVGGEREEPLAERRPSGRPGARSRPRRRGRRTGEEVAARARARRRGRASRRSGTRRGSTSPSSAPTTAGRPRSSASRAATSPTIPTLHGPRTTVAAGGRRLVDERPAPRRRAVFIRSRRSRLAASSASACGPRPRRRRRRAAAGRPRAPPPPGRPRSAAARWRRRPSRGRPPPASTRARSSSAAIPGRGAVRSRSRPSRAIARFSPTIGATSATVPIVARSARSRAAAGPPGLVRQEQLGDLERDAAPRQARDPGSASPAGAG